MKTSEFYYDLPKELIAQTPVEPRDSARLLVMDKNTGALTQSVFRDIGQFLRKGDLLVVNNTKVIPARIFGYRSDKESVTKYEALLLRRINYTDWECIMRPAKKAVVGAKLKFSDELFGTVIAIGDSGVRTLRFCFEGVFEDILSRIGNMPLPPYIHEQLEDPTRYNTVYSKIDGSAAAPTAGLHFTPELMENLKKQGVEITEVLLHVGLGTFRPVKAEEITDHKMHSEYYELSSDSEQIINKAVKEGRRVIAVGTTSGRVLESVADENGYVHAGHGETQIFIYPGYKFKVLKGMITNFHLPESTLIMYVSAFAGMDNIKNMYKFAVENKYRFFSFGDATLLI